MSRTGTNRGRGRGRGNRHEAGGRGRGIGHGNGSEEEHVNDHNEREEEQRDGRREVPESGRGQTSASSINHVTNSAQGDTPPQSSTTLLGGMGRIRCYPQGDRLMTDRYTDPIASHINDIFRKDVYASGFNWKMIPEEQKNIYFEEFRKLYMWDPSDEVIIKKTFFKQAGEAYKKLVSSWKKKPKPGFIKEDVWESFQEYWKSPEVEKKSNINQKNRLSEVAGPGTGPSKHICGRRAILTTVKHLRKERIGEEPDAYEQFLRTHMRNNGTFADKHSEDIRDKVESLIAAAQEDGQEIDRNKVYMDVVGGVKKQRIFGLGSAACNFIKKTSASSSTQETQESGTLREEVQQLTHMLEDRDAKYEEMKTKYDEMQATCEAERAARLKFEESVKEQMATMLREALRTGNCSSTHGSTQPN